MRISTVLQKKRNVAVLFGGRSTEHEISLITGNQLLDAVDDTLFHPIPVYVALNGKWYTGDCLFERSFFKEMVRCPSLLDSLPEVVLLPKPGINGLTVLSPGRGKYRIKESHIAVDVFLPAFHGTLGEDGCVQGLLELAEVPYTGCGVFSSAVGMNKWATKEILSSVGIPVLCGIVVGRGEAQKDLNATRQRILSTPGLEDFPLFVKPCNLGSSVAVHAADDFRSLDAALADVFQYDMQALVEPKITDLIEVNVAVLGGTPPLVSVIEMPLSRTGVLTYEDKYMTEGASKYDTPASEGMASLARLIDPDNLADELKSKARRIALEAYRTLDCAGVARIDCLVDCSNDSLYFNEINTLPGSLAFYLWPKSKPSLVYTELITRIIEEGLSRHRSRNQLRKEFGFHALSR